MDPRAVGVLRRFVDKLGGEVQVSVRRGSKRSERWETFSQVWETVTAFVPDEGIELALRDGAQVRLHFSDQELLDLLHGSSSRLTQPVTYLCSSPQRAAAG